VLRISESGVPFVSGVLTPAQCRQTARSIAATQESSGAIPWSEGGHTDPWDHVENAMALTATGLLEPARAAFDWCRDNQRADGSWPIQLRNGVIEDANSDSNFCAYIATGVWHHVLVTDDPRFAEDMWPVVSKAVDFVLDLQRPSGEIAWARSDSGPEPDALLTGCASIYHSLRCALALADYFDDPQPEWEVGVGQLGHAIAHHPDQFVCKDRWSMEWYYPVLGGALRGAAARSRIDERWDDFVVPGLGIRCVDDRPWVTGAETCELVMALDAIGETSRAREQFAAMHHLREEDGSYWTGLVFADGKRWPEERTTWTGAAMILAADALSSTTAASGIFRGVDLPRGLEGEFDCACATSGH
jgi:MMP endo-(1,4)-3-O-methyl-alpha-D-mannosidase